MKNKRLTDGELKRLCDTYDFEWTEEVYNEEAQDWDLLPRFTTIYFTYEITEGCGSDYYQPAEQCDCEIQIHFWEGDEPTADAEREAEELISEMILEDCPSYY